jgi:hypothetical protein
MDKMTTISEREENRLKEILDRFARERDYHGGLKKKQERGELTTGEMACLFFIETATTILRVRESDYREKNAKKILERIKVARAVVLTRRLRDIASKYRKELEGKINQPVIIDNQLKNHLQDTVDMFYIAFMHAWKKRAINFKRFDWFPIGDGAMREKVLENNRARFQFLLDMVTKYDQGIQRTDMRYYMNILKNYLNQIEHGYFYMFEGFELRNVMRRFHD